jgi:formimidoylglutamase
MKELLSAGVWPERSPSRLAAGIELHDAAGCQVALLGLPDDLGVRLNGGRPGASEGPTAFRRALSRFGVPFDGLLGRPLRTKVFDAGDVKPAPGDDEAALCETHRRIMEVVASLHQRALVPVCIGGGHDLSLPAIRALAQQCAGQPFGGVNLDAHLDVRRRVGSGMPFRRLIDEGCLDAKRFVELGLGRFANDRDDVEWLRERGATLIFAEQLFSELPVERIFRTAQLSTSPGFVSIDLDGLDQSQLPGVSATNPMGVSVRHAAQLAEAAGRTPSVAHFDLMELCPARDHSDTSARVAALLFCYFLAGFEERVT